MSWWQEWESACIHNPQARNTINPRMTINNGVCVILGTHFASRRGVPNGLNGFFDNLQVVCISHTLRVIRSISESYLEDLGISIDFLAREVLISNHDLLHEFCGECLPHSLVTCDGNLLIDRRLQICIVDSGQDIGVSRVNGDVSTRLRCHQSSEDSSVLESILWF